MDELQIAAERAWIIISTCIIIVLALGAISVLVWWIIQNIKDARAEKNKENSCNKEMLEHSCETYAAAADAGWGSYIEMKGKYDKLSDDFDDYKSIVERWDAHRRNRIKQLEEQLRTNNIEPEPWDFPSGKECCVNDG